MTASLHEMKGLESDNLCLWREILIMTNRVYSKTFILMLFAVATTLCCWGPCYTASAQPEPVANSTSANAYPPLAEETVLASEPSLPFVYNSERPDPFFPFLSQEIMKAEAKANAELTGTQKFEPAQLTLVAIVSGKRGFLAMVQDSSGVGYVLRKGTKVGETGEVVQITQDKVIIEQSRKNITGEHSSRKVEMILNKEGEK